MRDIGHSLIAQGEQVAGEAVLWAAERYRRPLDQGVAYKPGWWSWGYDPDPGDKPAPFDLPEDLFMAMEVGDNDLRPELVAFSDAYRAWSALGESILTVRQASELIDAPDEPPTHGEGPVPPGEMP